MWKSQSCPQGSAGLSDSFDSAKEDAAGAIKTTGRPRDPRDEVGGRLCHRRVLFNFPRIFKEDFQCYMLTCKTHKTTNNENWSSKKRSTWQLTTSRDKKQETLNR